MDSWGRAKVRGGRLRLLVEQLTQVRDGLLEQLPPLQEELEAARRKLKEQEQSDG